MRSCHDQSQVQKENRGHHVILPIDIAIVLPSIGKVWKQFDAGKDAPFALNRTNKTNGTLQATRNIDRVAESDIGGLGTAWCCRNHILGRVAQDRIDGVTLSDIGDAGKRACVELCERGLARQRRSETRVRSVCGLEIRGRDGAVWSPEASRRRLGSQLWCV